MVLSGHTRECCHPLLRGLKIVLSIFFSFRSIRQAAYNTLGLWCKITKYGSLAESIGDDLIKHIIQDVSPFRSEVTLKVLSGARKHLSKKARQKLHKAQNDATNLAQTHSKSFNPHNTKIIYSDSGNEQLCATALKCLTQFLHASGCFLKPILQKILQETVVSLSIESVSGNHAKETLYSPVDCRENLYEALFALVISPHHLCSPPLQYAASVFSIAQTTDSSYKVRERCVGLLRALEKVLHPQKEVFQFPTEVNDVRDALKNGNAGKEIDSEASSSEEEDMQIEIERPTAVVKNSPEEGAGESTVALQGEPVLNASNASEKTNGDQNTSIESFHSMDEPIEQEVASESVTGEAPQSLADGRLKSPQKSDAEDFHLTPPRKSARLEIAAKARESSSSPAGLESPRRKSARLTAHANDTPEEKKSGSESEKAEGDRESVKDDRADDLNKSEDELVNAMVSEFVDEFLPE